MKILTTDNPRWLDLKKNKVVIQKCGDRDKDGSISVHDYSNTIPANPMSDRGQLCLELNKQQNRDG